MLRSIGKTLALALVLSAVSPAWAIPTYKLDNVHSAMCFRIKHNNVSYFYGRFNTMAGEVRFDKKSPEKSKFEITIETASVDTANEKRDAHLRTADFFDADKYPRLKFVSKEVEVQGNGKMKVKGDLTLHGVTKEVSVDIEHTGSGKNRWGGKLSGFEAKFTIKRSEFGMTKYLESLSDEVNLMLGLQCVLEEKEEE